MDAQRTALKYCQDMGHANGPDVKLVAAAITAERERAASIAEELATRWEGSAQKIRQQGSTRFFFIGPAYTTPRAEANAKSIEAAAHGLRTVASLIRDGVQNRH